MRAAEKPLWGEGTPSHRCPHGQRGKQVCGHVQGLGIEATAAVTAGRLPLQPGRQLSTQRRRAQGTSPHSPRGGPLRALGRLRFLWTRLSGLNHGSEPGGPDEDRKMEGFPRQRLQALPGSPRPTWFLRPRCVHCVLAVVYFIFA